MVKFIGRFLFLPLCLSLSIGVVLAEPNIEQNDGIAHQSQEQIEDFTNVVGTQGGYQSQ